MPLRRIFPLFAGLAFLIYGYGLITNGFVEWDDFGLIANNDFVKHPTLSVFWSYDPELYIPLTFLTYQIEYALFGATPQIFHLTNLLLHIGSGVLVFLIMQRLLDRTHGGVRPGLLVALLFLVHPINTETVVWAAARKDVLASFFFLLSLYLYLRDRLWWSVAAFAVGLFAKVSIVLLPGVLLLVDWYRRPPEGVRTSPTRWPTLKVLTPYLTLSVLFIVVAMFGKPGSSTYLLDKVLLGTRAMVLYLWNIFLPTDFSVLYPFTEPMTLGNWKLLLPLLFVIVTTVIIFILRNRCRSLAFAWGFYVLTVLPSFGNPVKGDEYLKDLYIGSDRYAYLASMSVFFLFSLGLYRLREMLMRRQEPGTRNQESLKDHRRTGMLTPLLLEPLGLSWFLPSWALVPRLVDAIAIIILLALSTLAFRQSLTWHDSESLFRNVLRVAPNAQLAHNNIGGFLYERGDYEGAQWHFEKSILIRPTGRAFFNLGQIYVKKEEKEKAIEAFGWAYTYDPTHESALVNYAALKLDAGDAAEAKRALERALEIDLENTDALFNLGVAFEKLGDTQNAIATFGRLLEIDPLDEEAKEKREGLLSQ